MAAGGPRLFGLLVTYKRHDALEAHLEALVKQTHRLDHLLVVDNGPSGAEEDLVRAYPEAATTVEYEAMPDNVGPAGGYRRGLQHLLTIADRDDWVVLLDDDDPPRYADTLEGLWSFAQDQLVDHPQLGMVGSMGARFDFGRGRIVRLLDAELRDAVPVDYVPGGGIPFVRFAAVEAVGGHTEELFFGFEELEFGLRLRRAGFDVLVDGEMGLASRVASGRLGDMVGIPSLAATMPNWRHYYSLRNLVHILRTYGHPLAAARVALRGWAKALVVLMRDRDRPALDYGRVTLAATLDGGRGRLGRRVEPDPKP